MSLLVIGTLRFGPLRFGELETAIGGISQLVRTGYAEVPPWVEYEMTELGRSLVPFVVANHEQINANRRSRSSK
ncbi:helix-turn-helix domain-containing protein [Streptomyces sp. NPDC001642]|uniref:winged helix-turn-helix transcriptional regulator n=1 Tax=Streptomyces sp. NPDC001642 TaxID=3154392 RepID=UPI0033268FE6